MSSLPHTLRPSQLFSSEKVKVASLRDYGVVFALMALFLTLTFSSSAFLTEANMLNILDQWAPVALMALGGTVVVIAGGFDLSVGAIYLVATVVAADIANSASPELGILAGILVGLALGLANGLLITLGRLNDFVVTIGSSIVFSGLALVITGGFLVSVADLSFGNLGQNEFLGLKWSIWILVAAVVACWFLLNWTAYGRRVRAVGGNREAALLSGIRVGAIRSSAYAISGLGAGIAGVIVASRSLGASAQDAGGTAFLVWAAILVGGNSLGGGEGAIWRTLVGVAFLALIQNGFNLLGVDPTYQQIVTGGILLTSVALDAWVRRHRA